MPGKTYDIMYGLKCYEWKFPDKGVVKKIIYNPAWENVPTCITVFTRDQEKHGQIQVALDPAFPISMGRDNKNTDGTGDGNNHTKLHNWIEFPTLGDGKSWHDHFVVPDAPQVSGPHKAAITFAVTKILGLGFIPGPVHDVIQFLERGIAVDSDSESS